MENVTKSFLNEVVNKHNLPGDALDAVLKFAAYALERRLNASEGEIARLLAETIDTELRIDRGYGDAPFADIYYIVPIADGRPIEGVGGFNSYDLWKLLGRNPHDCEKFGGARLFLDEDHAWYDEWEEPAK